MREYIAEGRSLPEAYHRSLELLYEKGEVTPCPDYNTNQKELSMTLFVSEPLSEPMISRCFIGGYRELEQYRQEMLDGILDFEIERGNWAYTYHSRMAEQVPFVIRDLKIGRVIVRNLPAFVITKQNVPLIVGNSAFDCFGTVTVDGLNLIIDDRFEEDLAQEETPAEPAEDPAVTLERKLQKHMEAKEYAQAADCFAALQEMGVLTMYSEYQYAMVLNILRRNDDCIALTLPWLEENEGKSLTLDYWMFDALGDCYARKGNRQKAIRYYEDAVDAYCKIFNTTEKDIRKTKFKDETLGYTLYDLAMQYASFDMGKTRYYCTLAAKSGNASAIAFCKKSGFGY